MKIRIFSHAHGSPITAHPTVWVMILTNLILDNVKKFPCNYVNLKCSNHVVFEKTIFLQYMFKHDLKQTNLKSKENVINTKFKALLMNMEFISLVRQKFYNIFTDSCENIENHASLEINFMFIQKQ
jgi:hypothetical protein